MRMYVRLVLFGTLATGALLASERAASGYVREVTRACNPVHWEQTCVYVTSDSGHLPDLALADIERIVQESLDSWRPLISGGSFLQLKYLPADGPRETIDDGLQVIKFRTDTWCLPAEDNGGEPICYDPVATALTTVTYVSSPDDPAADGRIIDADIQLNAVDNYFYDADVGGNPPVGDDRAPTDLWNTLSHELGHLMGLDETCHLGFELPDCLRDDTGKPVIDCQTVENGHATDPQLQAIYDTTMYAVGKPREIKKRHPKADDVAGVVAASPLAHDPGICEMPGGDGGPGNTPAATPGHSAGCSVAGRSAPGALALLAVFASWRWRRIRRRGR